MKIGIVIPHHLSNLDFLTEWRTEFSRSDTHLYIVEDKDSRETSVPDWLNHFTIFTHQDIKDDLGDNAWIIPFKTSAIRSYGYYKVFADGCDYVLTLDNDCYPEKQGYWIDGHLANLGQQVTLDWVSSIPGSNLPTRGFPYLIRDRSPVGVSHGLWSNVPDFDGVDMLKHPDWRFEPCTKVQLIPRHNFYPMCGMNLAFRREIVPLMYFGLQGPSWGLDQYDDIWAGVLSKKVMDHLGYAVLSGYPSVEHRKQSNAFVNLQKQAPGLAINEELWRQVQAVRLTQDNPIACYRALLDQLDLNDDYWLKYKQATHLWLDLYQHI